MPTVYTDTYLNTRQGIQSSCSHIAAITPHDTNDLTYATVSILASADCTVKVDTLGGETVTAYPLQKGYNDIRVTRVYSTGTTLGGATIFALW
jgi:hypothetical protein